jgi:hypothetical protein
MSADLERRYARLLAAYPAGYRHEHQAEILATLLAIAAIVAILLATGGARAKRLSAETGPRPDGPASARWPGSSPR